MRILGLALAVVLFAACGRGEPVSGPSADADVAPSGSPAVTSSSSTSPASGPSVPGGPSSGGTATAPGTVAPVPDVLVPADAGTHALAVGTSVAVRLDREHEWAEPDVDGGAVEVTRTAFESDPGYDEYEVRGRAPGTAVVTFSAPDATARFSFVVE